MGIKTFGTKDKIIFAREIPRWPPSLEELAATGEAKNMIRTFPFLIAAAFLSAVLFSGCNPSFGYSLKGISIPPDVKTFYVDLFAVQTADAVEPTLPRNFTEKLKNKIRRESSLQISETDPDIEFSGGITTFAVTLEAPQADEQIGFQKLTIAVQVEFVNNNDEEQSWKQRFSFFDQFNPEQNLLDVQETLIENITDELADQVFNRAFTNW